MMMARMVPGTLPLILLYRTIARGQLSPARSRIAMMLLLTGYLPVWAAAGIPVYGYSLLAAAAGSLAAVLPALLLVAGGIYQFTRSSGSAMPAAAARCSSCCTTGGRGRPGRCGSGWCTGAIAWAAVPG